MLFGEAIEEKPEESDSENLKTVSAKRAATEGERQI